MRQRETRIRLSEDDHERLRVAAAYAKKSMAEFAKYATLKLIDSFEAEYQARITAHRESREKSE